MRIYNPLLRVDMPDPDIIRVNNDFYMVSTTMFYMPAAPVLKSSDLQHWQIVSYICNNIADNDIYHLKNGRNAYGRGQWATSLMQYKDRFYACFVCHDMGKTYLFSTDDIEKSDWNRTELDAAYHDMSFLCWENKVYLIYGNGVIRIVELKEDLSGVVEGSDRMLFDTPKEGLRLRCEGCRAYVKDRRIYLLFIDWPEDKAGEKGIRREVCYRLKDLSGEYERKTILYDDMWIPGCGIAQGPIFDDSYGNWYAMMFQDSGAVGRVLFLLPVEWRDGWPVLGTEGKTPESLEVPFEEKNTEEIIQSDSFSYNENALKIEWQWNHAPNNDAWSFTERPGFLRLINRKPVNELLEAENVLTQRTKSPYSVFTVKLDSSGMKDGDFAGLCALVERYGQIGVRRSKGKQAIVLRYRDGERAPYAELQKCSVIALNNWYSIKEKTVPLEAGTVWLRVEFRFANWKNEPETVGFYYSTDGKNYISLGKKLEMFYSISMFVGARIGIFSYNEKNTVGGCADFCEFVASFDENGR